MSFHGQQLIILDPKRLIKLSGTPEEALVFWTTEGAAKIVTRLRPGHRKR